MPTLGSSLAAATLLLLPVPLSPHPEVSHSTPVAENISVADFASSLSYSLTDRPCVAA